MIVRAERMSPAFIKYHLNDGSALHRFVRPEPYADPHDHPWSFETEILDGGYVDEVFHLNSDGSWHSEHRHRVPGETYRVDANHIHRIVDLPAGECTTIILPGSHQQTSGFYQFREDGAYHRYWDQADFQRMAL